METKLTGRVAEGRGIGRRLGYATANIATDQALSTVRNGVYAAWVWRAGEGEAEGAGCEGVGRRYGAMANLGVKPTFEDGGERILEVHLFDFEGNLYGERLTVELVRFIRPERKFASTDKLAAQITKDQTAAKHALEQVAPIAKDAPATKRAPVHAARKTPYASTPTPIATSATLAFERITDTDHPLFEDAWRLYISSFPPEERRQLRTQRKIMADAPYHFELIIDRAEGANGSGKKREKSGKNGGQTLKGSGQGHKDGGALVGILLWWGFDDMRYLEHFATVPRLRGGGLGARALAAFTARSAVPVVLEVEPPETELSRRRVGFYRRQGFVASERPYTHPPYKRGGERVPLMLMSHPAPITDAQFASFMNVHHPVIHRFAM